jgi:raffinose/stachyose/melibiose transport system permease protein
MKFKKMYREFKDFIFLLPALLIFLLIVVTPFIRGIGISLTNWDGISKTSDFVGLKNFRILFHDQDIIGPIQHTLLFTILTVLFVNIIGLALALGVNTKFRGSNIIKSMLFMPMVISLVLASFMWTYIYSAVFPKLLGIHGLLGSTGTVILGLTIICVWKDAGLAMVTYYAGLQSIPQELYDAARVDGANLWQQFKSIIIPMLAPAFTINITLWLGWGLKVFDYPMAATGGGPGSSSQTVAMYVYKYAFPYNKAGYGQAAAISMMIIIFVITGIVTSILRKRELDI